MDSTFIAEGYRLFTITLWPIGAEQQLINRYYRMVNTLLTFSERTKSEF